MRFPHVFLLRLYLSELPGRDPGELRAGSGRGLHLTPSPINTFQTTSAWAWFDQFDVGQLLCAPRGLRKRHLVSTTRGRVAPFWPIALWMAPSYQENL